MPKSVFISHVHEDAERIQQIEQWAKDGLLGDVVITKETNDFRQMGEEAIKKHLRPKIQGCAVVLVLIGNDTHNHDWITYEVQVAKTLHKRVIAVRIKDTQGAPPKMLSSQKLVRFNAAAVKKAVEGLECSTEPNR